MAPDAPSETPTGEATKLCVILGGMTDDGLAELRAAARALSRAERVVDDRRAVVHALIVAKTNQGHSQKAIAEAADVTRETVRRVVDLAKKAAAKADAS